MTYVRIHDEKRQRWLGFDAPVEIVSAHSIDDIPYRLRQIESMVQYHNLWAVGFLTYEAAPAFDRAAVVRSASQTDSPDVPLLWFGLFRDPNTTPELSIHRHKYDIGAWTPELTRESYLSAIDRVKRRIFEGDTYQVNYTYRQHATFRGDVGSFFYDLSRRQPGGFGCLIDTDAFGVASVSPELFFRLENGIVTTRPMKGTAPRGASKEIDDLEAESLRQSAKNRAENLMIVDMMRNDLSRIAKPGTVAVPSLFEIERYPTVLQMTSTITAETTRSWSDVLAALFPCSSITGAPKLRTMQIIAEVERSARGLYTGTIGYLAPDGSSQMNVAIRTATINKQSGLATYGIGGGIVADSDPQSEFEESVLKARVLVPATSEPTTQETTVELLETMRYDPRAGIVRFDRHMNRLVASAESLGIPLDVDSIKRTVRAVTGEQSLRVRLVASARSHYIETMILESDVLDQPVRATLANAPIDHRDPLIFHKTTNRAIYQRARGEHPESDDVLLYNERGEVTEFTIGNIVIELRGRLVTPARSSGLLPGTFRQALLDGGEIEEGVVTLKDLRNATAIFRINSVREWQRVTLD